MPISKAYKVESRNIDSVLEGYKSNKFNAYKFDFTKQLFNSSSKIKQIISNF